MPRRALEPGPTPAVGDTAPDATSSEAQPKARTVLDLPPGRRENLLWRLSSLKAVLVDQPLEELLDTCTLQAGMTYGDRAVQDRSGVYHLFAGDRSICLGPVTRSEWCEGQVRFGAGEAAVNVAQVPLEERCARAAGRWPSPATGRDARATVRRQLVEALGPGCATCPDPWATKIDHDHFTGLVRGYLCTSCNTVVDLCPHLSGCRFSEYLAEPPARAMAITYPGWKSELRSSRYAVRRQRFVDLMTSAGLAPTTTS